MLLPLLVAGVIAYLFTVLALKRSILTEKVSRRGYHLSREYSVDPLEVLFVREVMRNEPEEPFQPESAVAYPDEPLRVVVYRMAETGQTRLPVVERDSQRVTGVVSLEDLLRARTRHLNEEQARERLLRFRLPFTAARTDPAA